MPSGYDALYSYTIGLDQRIKYFAVQIHRYFLKYIIHPDSTLALPDAPTCDICCARFIAQEPLTLALAAMAATQTRTKGCGAAKGYFSGWGVAAESFVANSCATTSPGRSR
jgi:hypothetical protein